VIIYDSVQPSLERGEEEEEGEGGEGWKLLGIASRLKGKCEGLNLAR
jgi:hypothetical protein